MKLQRRTAAYVMLGLAGLYAILNALDGCVLWYDGFANAGLINTVFHAVLTLGFGASDRALRLAMWQNVQDEMLKSFAMSFAGVAFILLLVLAVAMKRRGWKIPAAVLAGVPLIGYVLMLVGDLKWLPVAAVSAYLLWLCITDKKSDFVPLVCLGMAVISIAVTVWLSNYRIEPHRDEWKYMGGMYGLQQMFDTYKALVYYRFFGNHLWPLSQGVWFLVMGFGLHAIPKKGKLENARNSRIKDMLQGKLAEKTIRASKSQYSYLEEYKRKMKG